MGKHKHSKASTRDLLALRTAHEQQWAYERRLEHLSYRAIRQRAAMTPEEGGLGYDVSEQALSRLVAGYRHRMSDVLADATEAQVERELHDLDLMQRAIAAQLARDEASGIRLDPALVREHRALGERRAKLLGLDALPSEAANDDLEKAERTELNAMLAEAGLPPLESSISTGQPHRKDPS